MDVTHTDPESFSEWKTKMNADDIDKYLKADKQGRTRYLRTVIDNRKELSIDDADLAERIVKAGDPEVIASLLGGGLIEGMPSEEIIKTVSESMPAEQLSVILDHLRKRDEVLRESSSVKFPAEVAYAVLGGEGEIFQIRDNFRYFKEIDFGKIYEILLEKKCASDILYLFDEFPSVDSLALFVQRLIDDGYIKKICTNFAWEEAWLKIKDILPSDYLNKINNEFVRMEGAKAELAEKYKKERKEEYEKYLKENPHIAAFEENRRWNQGKK